MASGQWKSVMILLLIGFISAAGAHDGTVNISGTIQDNTCELAPDSQNKYVDMGVVAGSQFKRTGDFSPATHFTLNLQNCGPAASGAVVTFSGTADTLNRDLFSIEDVSDSANGIGLGIYDSSNKRIAPGTSSSEIGLKPGQTSAAMVFTARYVAVKDEVTSGTANVTVTFVVNYS